MAEKEMTKAERKAALKAAKAAAKEEAKNAANKKEGKKEDKPSDDKGNKKEKDKSSQVENRQLRLLRIIRNKVRHPKRKKTKFLLSSLRMFLTRINLLQKRKRSDVQPLL